MGKRRSVEGEKGERGCGEVINKILFLEGRNTHPKKTESLRQETGSRKGEEDYAKHQPWECTKSSHMHCPFSLEKLLFLNPPWTIVCYSVLCPWSSSPFPLSALPSKWSHPHPWWLPLLLVCWRLSKINPQFRCSFLSISFWIAQRHLKFNWCKCRLFISLPSSCPLCYSFQTNLFLLPYFPLLRKAPTRRPCQRRRHPHQALEILLFNAFPTSLILLLLPKVRPHNFFSKILEISSLVLPLQSMLILHHEYMFCTCSHGLTNWNKHYTNYYLLSVCYFP